MFRKTFQLGIFFVAALSLAAALPQQASAQYFSVRTPGFRLSIGNGGYYNQGYYVPGYYAPPVYNTYVAPAPVVYSNYATYGSASYAVPGYVAPVVSTDIYYNQVAYPAGGVYVPRRYVGGRYWR